MVVSTCMASLSAETVTSVAATCTALDAFCVENIGIEIVLCQNNCKPKKCFFIVIWSSVHWFQPSEPRPRTWVNFHYNYCAVLYCNLYSCYVKWHGLVLTLTWEWNQLCRWTPSPLRSTVQTVSSVCFSFDGSNGMPHTYTRCVCKKSLQQMIQN